MRLIDADALVETLNNANIPYNADVNYFITYAPTIDARPKGKWIEQMDCEGKSRRIMCDKCGHEEWNWLNPNFCPKCGADMRGDDNE